MTLCPSRFRLFVCAAVLLTSVTGRAELTQAQMSQAVLDALEAWGASNNDSIDGLLWYTTYPTDDQGASIADMYLEYANRPVSEWLFDVYLQAHYLANHVSFFSNITEHVVMLGNVISNQLERAYNDAYKTAVTNTCQVITNWFEQYRTFSGRVTNDLGLIRQRFDRNLSDLDARLESISDYADGIWYEMYRLTHEDTIVTERIDEVLSLLAVVGGSITNDLLDEINRSRTILEDVQLTLDDNYDLLYYIEQNTGDAVEGIAGIYHELEDGLFNIFSEAIIWAMNDPGVSNKFYDIDYRPNLEEIRNHLMAIEDCVSNIYADVPPILNSIDTNTLYTLNAVTNWYPIATNYYGFATNFFDDARDYFAKMLPRDSDLFAMYEITNSVRTNALADADFYTSETNRLEEELEDLEPDLDDYLTENPWDQADGWIEGVGEDVTEGLEVENISWTDNLILFGSWDRRSDVVPLPRIEVDMGDVFESYPALRGVSGIVRSLWTFCGVFFRLILLFRFLDWFAKRRKG